MASTISALFLEPIIHGVGYLLRKIERLIGTETRAETGRNALKVLVNLPSVIEQIAVHCQSEPATKSICLVVDVEPDALVLGDFSELHEALELLVGTTLKHTPDGDYATVWGAAANGVVTLIFSTGCLNERIEEPSIALADRCFAGRMPPFRKITSCPRRAAKIVEAHGGYIEINNQLEHRSRLIIRLPVA